MRRLALALALLPGVAAAQGLQAGLPSVSGPAGVLSVGTASGTVAGGNDLRLSAVNLRPPSPTDDAAHGYAVGNFWQVGGTLRQAIQTTPGFGMWQVVPGATALPVDAAPVTPWAAYGMRLLRAAYTGKAINVVRASDGAASDVGFRADGSLDTPTLDAFCGSTTCRVATWYDQSGAGNNATAASGARPEVLSSNTIGNSRSIVFDSAIFSSMGLASEVMTLPADFPGTTANSAVVTLSRFGSEANNTAPVQLTGASFQMYFFYTHTGQTFTVAYNGVGLLNGSFPPSQTPVVTGYLSTSTALTLFNGEQSVSGAPVAAASLATGGTIGAASDVSGSNGYMETAAVLIYSGLSTTNLAAITASLHAAYQTTPQARDNLLVAGDSITFGTGGSNLQTYSRKMEALLPFPLQVFNYGYFGQTIAQMAAAFGNYAHVYSPAGRNNILTIFAGTNDIAGGASAATTYAALQSFCQQAHAAGWKVVVATMLPRNGLTGAQQAQWTAYNASIRSGWPGFADALADLQADPTMGPFAASSNNALYFDGTHPTDLGYTYIAPVEAAAVRGLMQ